jgi:hypothetical protein
MRFNWLRQFHLKTLWYVGNSVFALLIIALMVRSDSRADVFEFLTVTPTSYRIWTDVALTGERLFISRTQRDPFTYPPFVKPGFKYYQTDGMVFQGPHWPSRFGLERHLYREEIVLGGFFYFGDAFYGAYGSLNTLCSVFIPLWLFLLPAICTIGYRLIPLISRRSRRSSLKCEKCGYDLRATPDRCPECGTVPQRPTPAK